MNRHQRKTPLPITYYPAFRRAIQGIEESIICASTRNSALSDEEKIDLARLALFGHEALQISDSDHSALTGTIQSSSA